MRLSFSLALLFGALCACEAPLPEGAFLPVPNTVPGITDDAAAVQYDGGVSIPTTLGGGQDAGGDLGRNDGGAAGGTGGAAGGGADAGTQLSAQAARLDKLAGRYLMRVDMFSSASVPVLLWKIQTNNRASHLLVTELVREGETLKGYEKLCYQTFEHVCTKDCSTLTTVMNPNVKPRLAGIAATPRVFNVSESGALTTDMPEMFLGFDTSAADTIDTSLPTVYNDARIWDIIAGGVQEGMMLKLSSTGVATVNCNVYNVQRVAAKISGNASQGAGVFSLLNRDFDVVSAPNGTTVLGSDSRDCEPKPNSGGTSVDGRQIARFFALKASDYSEKDFWGCPAQDAWDSRLKPPPPETVR